jgi:hypothetical protein
MKGWSASGAAAILLALAMLMWSITPASECTTPQNVNWWKGLLPFALAVTAGAYAIAYGSRAQRLAVFLASAVVVCGYAWILSESLPEAITTAINCAAAAKR